MTLLLGCQTSQDGYGSTRNDQGVGASEVMAAARGEKVDEMIQGDLSGSRVVHAFDVVPVEAGGRAAASQVRCGISVGPPSGTRAGFTASSFGYRPGRSASDAVGWVRKAIRSGDRWVAEFDIVGFFDNLRHARLLREVAKVVDDVEVIGLGRTLG